MRWSLVLLLAVVFASTSFACGESCADVEATCERDGLALTIADFPTTSGSWRLSGTADAQAFSCEWTRATDGTQPLLVPCDEFGDVTFEPAAATLRSYFDPPVRLQFEAAVDGVVVGSVDVEPDYEVVMTKHDEGSCPTECRWAEETVTLAE